MWKIIKLKQLLNNLYCELDKLKENRCNLTEEEYEEGVEALTNEGNWIMKELDELEIRFIKRASAMVVLIIVICALISL